MLVSDVLQKPVSGYLLAEAAPFCLTNDVAGSRRKLQTLSAAVGKKGNLIAICSTLEFAGHDIGEQGEVAGKNVDPGIGDSLDLLLVAGDHGRFAADAPHADIEVHRGSAHFDDEIGSFHDLGVPFVGFDTGEVHAGLDPGGIFDDDLNGIGAGGDDVATAYGILRAFYGYDFDC